jgi:hypothetical protein
MEARAVGTLLTCLFSTQGETPAEVAGGAEALEQMLQEFGAAGPVALLALISLPTSRPYTQSSCLDPRGLTRALSLLSLPRHAPLCFS